MHCVLKTCDMCWYKKPSCR